LALTWSPNATISSTIGGGNIRNFFCDHSLNQGSVRAIVWTLLTSTILEITEGVSVNFLVDCHFDEKEMTDGLIKINFPRWICLVILMLFQSLVVARG
jgi:hypothetical protein